MSQAGDFEQLVRACHGELFAVLLARCGQREAAKDMLQEVLLSAWQHREKLLALPDGDRRRYLFAMMKNRAIDHARQASRQPRPAQPLNEPIASAGKTPPADARLEMLEHCMSRLVCEDRELLMMSTVGGMDSPAIAERVDSTPSTVRSRLSRIRQALRQCITAKMERADHAR